MFFRFKANAFTCMFCTEIIGCPTKFVRHNCYLNFLALKNDAETEQQNDAIVAPDTW